MPVRRVRPVRQADDPTPIEVDMVSKGKKGKSKDKGKEKQKSKGKNLHRRGFSIKESKGKFDKGKSERRGRAKTIDPHATTGGSMVI